MKLIAENWSAIVAVIALIVSFAGFLGQRWSRLQSVRPEIVLDVWERRTPDPLGRPADIVAFRKVRNTGSGSAYTVIINAMKNKGDLPLAMMGTIMIPILAAGDEKDVDGVIHSHWQNVEPLGSGGKHVSITIEITCWDSGRVRHVTEYPLLILEPSPAGIVQAGLAPGVLPSIVRITSRPVWWLRLTRKLKDEREAWRIWGDRKQD